MSFGFFFVLNGGGGVRLQLIVIFPMDFIDVANVTNELCSTELIVASAYSHSVINSLVRMCH